MLLLWAEGAGWVWERWKGVLRHSLGDGLRNTLALTHIVLFLLVNTSEKKLNAGCSVVECTLACVIQPPPKPQTNQPNYKENQVRRLERWLSS